MSLGDKGLIKKRDKFSFIHLPLGLPTDHLPGDFPNNMSLPPKLHTSQLKHPLFHYHYTRRPEISKEHGHNRRKDCYTVFYFSRMWSL